MIGDDRDGVSGFCKERCGKGDEREFWERGETETWLMGSRVVLSTWCSVVMVVSRLWFECRCGSRPYVNELIVRGF